MTTYRVKVDRTRKRPWFSSLGCDEKMEHIQLLSVYGKTAVSSKTYVRAGFECYTMTDGQKIPKQRKSIVHTQYLWIVRMFLASNYAQDI